MGWLNDYEDGLLSMMPFKKILSVAKSIFKVAVPLAFGNILSYAEWEIMTILAAMLGPAEAATWAVLGYVWGFFESTTNSIGSASELHVALSPVCRRRVTDMSPTSPNVAKSWPTLRVVATQKRPRHTQFSSITADKYKSAQTYEYPSYHRVFVFELKQHSRNFRHVGNLPTCRQMSCRLDTLADTTFSCVCDMTETCRDMSMSPDTTQNVASWAQKRHADI